MPTTMRAVLMPLLASGIVLFPFRPQSAQEQAKLADVRGDVSITSADIAALTGEVWEERRRAATALSSKHQVLIESLIRIVAENDEEQRPEARALAAQLLGEWHAISAIPVLAKHLSAPTFTIRLDSRVFDLRTYPCALAIAKMGPSALKPTLAELGKRPSSLSDRDVMVAAHLLVELCGGSKEDAIRGLLAAEDKFEDSKTLEPIRVYIEEKLRRN